MKLPSLSCGSSVIVYMSTMHLEMCERAVFEFGRTGTDFLNYFFNNSIRYPNNWKNFSNEPTRTLWRWCSNPNDQGSNSDLFLRVHIGIGKEGCNIMAPIIRRILYCERSWTWRSGTDCTTQSETCIVPVLYVGGRAYEALRLDCLPSQPNECTIVRLATMLIERYEPVGLPRICQPLQLHETRTEGQGKCIGLPGR